MFWRYKLPREVWLLHGLFTSSARPSPSKTQRIRRRMGSEGICLLLCMNTPAWMPLLITICVKKASSRSDSLRSEVWALKGSKGAQRGAEVSQDQLHLPVHQPIPGSPGRRGWEGAPSLPDFTVILPATEIGVTNHSCEPRPPHPAPSSPIKCCSGQKAAPFPHLAGVQRSFQTEATLLFSHSYSSNKANQLPG